MLPQSWGHVSSVLPSKLGEAILVTVHPDHVAPAVLAPIDLVLAVGEDPERTMRKFAGAVAQPLDLASEPVVRARQGDRVASRRRAAAIRCRTTTLSRRAHPSPSQVRGGQSALSQLLLSRSGGTTQSAGAESLDVLPDRRGN